MKRFGILFYIVLFFVWGSACYAQSQFSASLTQMEKSLFGVDYSSQNDDARLKRIEEIVYGQASSTSLAQRVSKLSKDLSADLMGHEIKPQKDTFSESEDGYSERVPKADSSVNYPVVNNLEQKVFRKEFKVMDINQRLANLEQNVFKKVYSDDLNSRVERLKAALMPPEKIAEVSEPDNSPENDDSSTPDDILSQNAPLGRSYFGPNTNQSVPSYNSQSNLTDDYQANMGLDVSLGALEKSVLRKSFPDDTVSNRLTRLELKVFNSSFVDDDEQTRFDRVASAYQAKKTSKKYDGNKVSQRVSTAVQVGAILLMILAAVL